MVALCTQWKVNNRSFLTKSRKKTHYTQLNDIKIKEVIIKPLRKSVAIMLPM